tara:strand:+ start:265 stop:2952 length:2688 start_codon:yes stop_codon:yes gene_type:complete
MESTLKNKNLQAAIAAHQSGDLQTAEAAYRDILAVDPDHSDANHNLGVLLVTTLGPETALPHFKTAVAANGSIKEYWSSYLEALWRAKRVPELEVALTDAESYALPQQTLDIWRQKYSDTTNKTSDVASASVSGRNGESLNTIDRASTTGEPSSEERNNLLFALQSNQLEAAEHQAGTLKRKYPHHPFGWKALGAILTRQHRYRESIAASRRALELSPADPEVFYNLGAAFKQIEKYAEAKGAFERAITVKPRSAVAHHQLGTCLAILGLSVEAESAYRTAIAINPELFETYLDLGVTLQEQGRMEDARDCFVRTLQLRPDDATAHANLGVNHRLLGNLQDALSSLKKAYDSAPGTPELCLNLGLTLQSLKREKEAESFLIEAVKLRPEYAEAFAVLGNLYSDMGNLTDAENCYGSALSLKPNFATVHSNLGLLLQNRNKLAEAKKHYQRAISIEPDLVEVHSNLGVLMSELENFEDAMASFERAVSLDPRYLAAWANGADILENWNKLPELENWLVRARSQFTPMPADLKFFEAQLLFRKKATADSLAILCTIVTDDLSEHLRVPFLNLQARSFDALGDYTAAFHYFKKMNLLIKQSSEYLQAKPDNYFDSVQRQLTQLREISLPHKIKKPTETISNSPIFIVGFPRSGTTLLDTILRTHSRIKVIEEEPIMFMVRSFIQRHDIDDIVGAPLPIKINQSAAEIYRTELRKQLPEDNSESIVIDKLPLNILHTPLIHQLFPDARFILVLRHPLDAVLSCWMQNFKINDVMANLVDLKRTVDMYCAVMETFKICREKYVLDVYEIAYEGLISDIEKEITSLLKFLGADWERQMTDYQQTAIERGKINTPSYSQVVQPLYANAKFRWLNYQEQLGEHLPKIEPWIKEFGYQPVTVAP